MSAVFASIGHADTPGSTRVLFRDAGFHHTQRGKDLASEGRAAPVGALIPEQGLPTGS
jgi:hypothetical protein